MSPAVVDFRSPVNTAQPNPPSFQNPNPNSHIPSHSPFDFGAFSSEKNFSEETVSEGSFGNAFSSPAASRTASAKPPVAAGISRSKPRLVKVRKHIGSQHGRSRTAPSEIDSGFNPFRSLSESSDRVNDVNSIGISVSNGFNAFVSDCKFKKFENVGFVFGANRSDSVTDLNLGKGETSGNVDNSSSYDNGKMENTEYGEFDNMGFVFGSNRSDLELNLDSGKRETRKSVDKSGSDDNGKMKNMNGSGYGKFDNVGFVFGANWSDLELNLDSGKREFSKSVDKLGSDDNGNMKTENESVYVKLGIDSRANLNPGKRESAGNAGKSGDTDNLGFVFGANQSDSVVNLNSEKRDFSDSVAKLGSDDCCKTKIVTETEWGKHENLGFVFGANLSNLASTSNSGKRDSSENGGKSCSDDKGKMKIGIEVIYEKSDDEDFVFGASGSNLASNPNLEKREGVGNVRSLISDDRGNMKVETETEFQDVKAAGVNFNIRERPSSSLDEDYEEGVFVFGSSSDQSSSFDEGKFTKLLDEMNKLKGENSGNCDGIAKIQNSNLGSGSGIKKNEYDNLGFDGDNKCSLAFGSSSNIVSAFGISPVFELPDEMKKLNINDFGKVIGDDKAKDSNIKSCTDAEKIFVFRSGTKASCSSAGSLETTCDQMKNSNSGGSTGGDAAEKTGGVNCKTSDENNFISGSSNDIDSASNEISSPKPYTFQVGLGTSSDVGQSPQGQANDDTKTNGAAMPASFLSNGLSFEPKFGVFEASPLGGVERKDGFSFTSTSDKLDASFMDFGLSKWDHSCFKANIFPGLNEKLEFSPRSRSADKRSKKMRGKLRQPTLAKVCPVQDFAPRESSSQEHLDSPGSPMDFSPYQETVAADQHPRETSVASSESSHMDNNSAASTAGATVSTDEKDEHQGAAGEGFDDNKGDTTCREPNEDGSRCYPEKGFVTDFPVEEFVSEVETAGSTSVTEQVCSSSDAGSGFSFNMDKQENNSSTHFSFASGLADMGGRNFTFSASPSAQGSLSATKRQYRKKYRMKVGRDSFNIIPSSSSYVQFLPFASTSSHLDMAQDQKGEVSSSQSKGENKSEAVEEPVEQEFLSASAVTKEVCEKWRLRGNQAYKNGDLSKAEDFYTWGINSVPASETLECCLKPLVLCYSNRAATRMSLGRMREALGDCRMAAALDPNFLKVQMRAANCHLVLGEVEDALQLFAKCLESGSDVCLDRRIIIEASDGLQKAQKVAECMNRCAELFQQRTSDAAISALELIAEALSISLYSEKLLEMKADALCMLRKYEEVIQLCEQTLDFAEKNFALVGAGNQLAREKGHECKKNSFVRLWRLHLISKSYFHLGRLEVALDLLEKQGQVGSITDKCESKTVESSIHLAVTIRELLCHKSAGNEAFQAERHTEALKHYSAALSSNVESRPFAAICFCNRAAAHQALGQIADAIADCSLAIALDGNYAKAVSRRATLHELIRDYAQAASDLQRFISIFEKPSHENAKQSGGSGGPAGSTKELRRAHRLFSSMEEQAKKEIPLDLYLILGIKPSDAASEIKKAYRKAALRHHPDKAGQFLARSESRDDGRLWKEIGEEVHKDADRLFKMIGEAYAVLSDPTKRSQYDLEEEMRNALKDRNNSSTFRRESDVRSSPFEGSANRRYWRESWNPYGNSHSRW